MKWQRYPDCIMHGTSCGKSCSLHKLCTAAHASTSVAEAVRTIPLCWSLQNCTATLGGAQSWGCSHRNNLLIMQIRCVEVLLKAGAAMTERHVSIILEALPTLDDTKVLLPALTGACLSWQGCPEHLLPALIDTAL